MFYTKCTQILEVGHKKRKKMMERGKPMKTHIANEIKVCFTLKVPKSEKIMVERRKMVERGKPR